MKAIRCLRCNQTENRHLKSDTCDWVGAYEPLEGTCGRIIERGEAVTCRRGYVACDGCADKLPPSGMGGIYFQGKTTIPIRCGVLEYMLP